MSGVAADGVDLVLVWHMHQPEYRLGTDRTPSMPWVYLHALKDYADMAAHLEAYPAARAVVNFVPVLLDQISDYAAQFASGRLRDPLLAMLNRPDEASFTADERLLVLEQCFHGNHEHMVAPFPPYRRLLALARAAEDRDSHAYLSDRYLFDLLTWYHLSWTGETVRRESALVGELMTAGSGFTFAQRRALIDLIGRVITQIEARFRRLEEEGRIELSTTPYFHPLAPLLLDFGSARQARPDLALPAAQIYPGGAQRLDWHIATARADHVHRFGRAPTGLWPAEGAVSDAVLQAAGRARIAWIASGQQVLKNSLRQAGRGEETGEECLYRPYRVPRLAPDTLCFFRDDRLSDLIGFVYRNWDGTYAAEHFVQELERIADHGCPDGRRPVVSVILDGENAWEYYPYNGYYFLTALYDKLADHPRVRMRTYRDWIAGQRASVPDAVGALPSLVAGSWVYGDLTTWIGSPDKNAAWDLLVAAKRSYDDAVAHGNLSPDEVAAAGRQLGVCESSDWFWWFGDYNPARSVQSFDRLYRTNLVELYRQLDLPAPQNLEQPLSQGSQAPAAEGAMRRAS
ncbi:MAG: glycoside hydrolase [Gemmatimonadota bacterium]